MTIEFECDRNVRTKGNLKETVDYERDVRVNSVEKLPKKDR